MKNQVRFMSTLGLCLGLFVFTTGLRANPTGGNVAAGSASIAGEGTGTVTVNQASNLTIINWQSFSINSGELTKFVQPSSTSAALNRVLGGQTSVIDGTLSANGQVYLINGNGVVVGPGGVISASAFTASTRDISDSDFLSGNLHFTGSNDAGVQNFGTINALGGDVVLIGKTVDNQGTINAPNGTAIHTGKIIAQGGQGGTGGNAEVSGAQVQFTGSVDLTSPGGTTGNLLIDPDTLEIIASGGTGTIGSLPPTGDSTINASDLVTALNGANITLQANDSISVNAAVDASGNGSAGNLALNTLTLNLNAGIKLQGAARCPARPPRSTSARAA